MFLRFWIMGQTHSLGKGLPLCSSPQNRTKSRANPGLWIRFSTNYVMSLFCLFQILFFWWGDLQNAIHSDLIQFYSYKSDDIPAKVRGCIPYVWACVHQKAEVWSVETFLGRWIQNRKAPSLRFRVPQDVSRPSKVANWTSHQRKFEQPKSIMGNSITSSMICGSHYVTV